MTFVDLKASEKQWQATVVEFAQILGWLVVHQLRSRGTEAGWPDLVLIRPPAILFVELKAENGRVRPEQELILDLLRQCGLEVYVWRPSDWNEVSKRLRRTGSQSREGATDAA